MNRKRIFLMILAVIILVALSFVYFGIVSDNNARIVVKTPSDILKPGDEFNVAVELENNPGIILFCLFLGYDDTRFEYVSVTKGQVLDEQTLETKADNSDGLYAVRVTNGFQTDAFAGNGTLYNVRFRVKEDAFFGKSTFSISYREGDIIGEPKQPGNRPNNFFPETIDASVEI